MRRRTRKKAKMLVQAVSLGVVCCGVIYGSLLWSGFRSMVGPPVKHSL